MIEENKTLTTSEGYTLTFSERESTEISINLSIDTIKLLEEIAKKKNLSVISIIKFFIGKGIRDLEPELANKSAVERFRNRKKFKEEKEEVDLAA